MNVWEYLDRNDKTETVSAALDGLRITQDERDKAMDALNRYKFVINSRAKSRFGCIKHGKMVMELTSEYFTNGYALHEERIADHDQTLLHEAAHIITKMIRPDASAHGDEWKAVMRALGIKPNRTGSANFLTEARKAAGGPVGKKHAYHCDRCDYVYQCNRRLKNISQRRHAKCGGGFTHKQMR